MALFCNGFRHLSLREHRWYDEEVEKAPVLTVIVPVYNSGKTLARALTSLTEEQDFLEPYEVLLMIDPSKDDSLAIAESFQKRHAFIRIEAPEKRLGIGLSRIEGIEKVTTPYFSFMDADDYLAPNCLSTLYKAIEETRSDCVNCSFYFVSGKKAKAHPFPWAKNAMLTREKALAYFFDDSYIRGFCWNKIYRTSIAQNRPLLVLGAPLDMQFEDVALNASLFSYCQKVTLLKKPLYYYDKTNAGSAMSVPRSNRSLRHLVVFALQRLFFEEKHDRAALQAFKKKRYRIWLSLIYDRHLDKKNGATKAYLKEVKQDYRLLHQMKKPLVRAGSFFENDAEKAFYSSVGGSKLS
jgi:glycosyltransferase involved in cell wall biosynthesis